MTLHTFTITGIVGEMDSLIEWRTAVVTDVRMTESENKYFELTVRFSDGTEGIAVYDGDDHGHMVQTGDQVLLNTTAVTLGLGTGGVHFVHAVLDGKNYQEKDAASVSASDSAADESTQNDKTQEGFHAHGHIMKLRYTSLQRSVLAAEEQSSPYHDLFTQRRSLEGMPVLVGELHSMLPMLLSRLRQRMEEQGKRIRIAYVMSDSAALPLAFSKHVRQLKQLKWLAGCITYGQAYGGDVEAVNKYTALLAAKHVLQADLAIVLPGPGSVGTDTRFGFSGTEVGEVLNAVEALDGQPIAIPRISFADGRERHFGISHHTLTVLCELTQVRAFVPLPLLDGTNSARLRQQVIESGLSYKHALTWHDPGSEEQWQLACVAYGFPIVSMERGLREDPAFWFAVGVSADFAWHYAALL